MVGLEWKINLSDMLTVVQNAKLSSGPIAICIPLAMLPYPLQGTSSD